MKKTMIYLEDNQHTLLNSLAERQSSPMSQLIRQAVNELLKKERSIPQGLPSFVGIAKGPRGGKTSEEVEAILQDILRKRDPHR